MYNVVDTAFVVRPGIALTSAVGLVFFVAPGLWLMIFTGDPALLSLGIAYLRIDLLTFRLIPS